MGPLTMRELMYAPVGGLAGLPPIKPDVDPLRVPDAIDESELMDVLIDVRREYAGLLLYAGGSLQLDVGNAFLLVARRLSALTWSRPMGPAPGELGTHGQPCRAAKARIGRPPASSARTTSEAPRRCPSTDPAASTSSESWARHRPRSRLHVLLRARHARHG